MNNKYKKAMSGVHHSDELIERIFDMTIDKKANKRLIFKRLASVTLALAILVGGGFGINSLNKKNDEQFVSSAGYSIGGIMTVEAKSELKGGTNADGKYDWGYRIYTKDITGLTEKEIKTEKENIAKLLICGGEENLKNEEHDIDKFTLKGVIKDSVKTNGNIIYAFERGSTEQCLTICGIDDPSTVKEIVVSNTSNYGQLIINANDLYYKKNSNGEYVFDGHDVNTNLTCIEGHNKSISGDRYEKCRIIENPSIKKYSKESFNKNSPVYGMELSTGKVFYFDYEFTNQFYDMLGQNPSFDLTNYKDEITINVEFKDGKVAKNIIDVTMDSNGKTYCQLISYNLD